MKADKTNVMALICFIMIIVAFLDKEGLDRYGSGFGLIMVLCGSFLLIWIREKIIISNIFKSKEEKSNDEYIKSVLDLDRKMLDRPANDDVINAVKKQLNETKYNMNQLINVVVRIVTPAHKLEDGKWRVVVNVDCYVGIKERTFVAKSEKDISVYKVGHSFWE